MYAILGHTIGLEMEWNGFGEVLSLRDGNYASDEI